MVSIAFLFSANFLQYFVFILFLLLDMFARLIKVCLHYLLLWEHLEAQNDVDAVLCRGGV